MPEPTATAHCHHVLLAGRHQEDYLAGIGKVQSSGEGVVTAKDHKFYFEASI